MAEIKFEYTSKKHKTLWEHILNKRVENINIKIGQWKMTTAVQQKKLLIKFMHF